MNPPPLAPPPPPDAKPLVAQQIALTSIVTPFLIFLLAAALRSISNNQTKPIPHLMHTSWGYLIAGLYLIGAILGIVALCSVKKYGPEKILTRSLIGLILNTTLLGIFVTNFITSAKKVSEQAQTLSAIQQSTQDFKQEVREAFHSKNGVTNANLPGFQRIRDQYDDASKKLEGPDAVFAQAMSAFLGDMQASLKKISNNQRSPAQRRSHAHG